MHKVLTFAILLRAIVIILLLVAISHQSLAFYGFLRLIVFAASIYFAYDSFQLGKRKWAIAYGLIALTFNPVLKVYLDKDVWQVVDVATALILFISLFESKLKHANGT